MINKKEFDLLLKEIFQIENKIVEVKILNQFEKATEYENALEIIRLKAKDIILDNKNESEGFDELSLDVFSKLIVLDSNIDYYILKTTNIIESKNENKIDAEALKKIKRLWDSLEMDIELWNKKTHNPIEEIEYSKHIGNITLYNIIYQLQTEGVLDFSKVFKYCKKELLINALKETLFEGAKNESHDKIKRNQLIEYAKKLSEKDLYDYKLWQQILAIKNVRSRDDHIEILGNLQDKNYKKLNISSEEYDTNLNVFSDNENDEMQMQIYETSDYKSIWDGLFEFFTQRQMRKKWATSKGPAFQIEFENGIIRYAKDFLDKTAVENVKKLTIATNGVSKYNFDTNSKWKNLEELIFLNEKETSEFNLNPNKTYNCIGNNSFENCRNLKKIDFGKIEMIGENAFQNCSSISEITFSKNLINIGENAFLNCTNLKKVEFLGDLKLYILNRPQNIINCFKGTNLETIIFSNLESIFNFAIIDCPNLKNILVSDIKGISIPFKTCKYRLGRQNGIVSFVGEKSLNLWKKRNTSVRFFELTESDKQKYNLN